MIETDRLILRPFCAEDAADVFGIHAANTDVTAGEVNHEGYKDVAKQLADRFGMSKVAITLRESISANDNNWSAIRPPPKLSPPPTRSTICILYFLLK